MRRRAAVLTAMKPEEVVDQVKASGIRGRGGAGFPTGQKWSFLAPAMPRYLVVNADESEPGTFKDRIIMEYDPHQLIEGIILSSFAIKAELAFIYIRGEYYFAYTRLVEAIKEATAKGFLGEKIFGTDTNLEIVVHRGAGAYECGEETALLTSLEGYPRPPAHEAALPGRRRSLRQADYRQQRRVDRQRDARYAQRASIGIAPLAPRNHQACASSVSAATSSSPASTNCRMPLPLREIIYTYGGGPQEDTAAIKAIVPGGLSMKLMTPDQMDTPHGL